MLCVLCAYGAPPLCRPAEAGLFGGGVVWAAGRMMTTTNPYTTNSYTGFLGVVGSVVLEKDLLGIVKSRSSLRQPTLVDARNTTSDYSNPLYFPRIFHLRVSSRREDRRTYHDLPFALSAHLTRG